jgi:hypothetical protein
LVRREVKPPHEAGLADEHVGLRRREGDALLGRLGQRLHLGHGRQRRAFSLGQAREQRARQGLGLGAVERADDGHARTAGALVARVKGLQVFHTDACQGLGRGPLAVRMRAVHGGGESLGGDGAGARVGLLDAGLPARALALPDGGGEAGLAELARGQAGGALQQVGFGERAQREHEAVALGAGLEAGAQVGPGFAQVVLVHGGIAGGGGAHALGAHQRGGSGQARLRGGVAAAAGVEVDLHVHHGNGLAFDQPDAHAAVFRPVLDGQQRPGALRIENGSSAYQ